MRVFSAKVVDGLLDVPVGSLQEGDIVTLLVAEPGGTFEVTSAQKSELLAAIAEADRGEVVDGWQLLAGLKA